MTTPNTAEFPGKEGALDWLFERIGSARIPARAPSNAPQIDIDSVPTSGVPEIRSPADLRRASEWLERERSRLESYTTAQLSRIRQEHQALVEQKYTIEQSLIARSQEVTRQEQLLVAQAKEIEPNTEGGGWPALAEAMEQHQQARAREEAAWQARHAQLETRFAEAARIELAAEQRLAELDDLEARLLHEAEQREQALKQRENSLAEWQAQLEEVADSLEEFSEDMGSLRYGS